MKTKSIIITALLCTAMLFSACDKIESDNYVIFSGVVGEWMAGNGVDDHSQRAFLEKYTGVRCVNCPTADDAISAALAHYGDKMIAVAIHDSSNFTKPYYDEPRLSTDDGNTWSQYFGAGTMGLPAAMVNRQTNGGAWDIFTPTSGINPRIDPILAQAAQVAVAVTSQQNNAYGLDIFVSIEMLETMTDAMTLTLLIMEDGINVTQLMPDGTRNSEYIQNHVLRDVITDVWGSDIDCTGTKGEKRQALFAYTDFDSSWNLANCHIVALISDKATRQIINVAECHAIE